MPQRTVCYSLRKLSAAQRSRFQRELYGFKDLSNNGRYEYRRPGIMDSIKHEKVYYSALRVSEKDLARVLRVLKMCGAEVHILPKSG